MLQLERLVEKKFNISTCSRTLLDHIRRQVHLDIQRFGLTFDVQFGKKEAMLTRIPSPVTDFPRDLNPASLASG